MNTKSLAFHFAGGSRLELIRTEFCRAPCQTNRVCVRGKTPGAFVDFGNFQWTTGVRAVCAAFLRYAISEQCESVDYCLIGGKGSLAASLDYALSKGPSWIIDMFGTGPHGAPYARRLFCISNPNRKRPGPVAISVNRRLISADILKILVDGRLVIDTHELIRVLHLAEGCETSDSTAVPVDSTSRLLHVVSALSVDNEQP
jgi:hypothetical protein